MKSFKQLYESISKDIFDMIGENLECNYINHQFIFRTTDKNIFEQALESIPMNAYYETYAYYDGENDIDQDIFDELEDDEMDYTGDEDEYEIIIHDDNSDFDPEHIDDYFDCEYEMEESITEAKEKITKINAKGQKSTRWKCTGKNQKTVNGHCVTMSSEERRNRKKGARIAKRKRKGGSAKQATRKRKLAMTKRKSKGY